MKPLILTLATTFVLGQAFAKAPNEFSGKAMAGSADHGPCLYANRQDPYDTLRELVSELKADCARQYKYCVLTKSNVKTVSYGDDILFCGHWTRQAVTATVSGTNADPVEVDDNGN